MKNNYRHNLKLKGTLKDPDLSAEDVAILKTMMPKKGNINFNAIRKILMFWVIAFGIIVLLCEWISLIVYFADNHQYLFAGMTLSSPLVLLLSAKIYIEDEDTVFEKEMKPRKVKK
jgi:hypothetical protein